MIEKIILKKSAVENKMPTTEQLEYGEIALNFNTMNPFLSFKDTADGIRQIRDYSNEIRNINGSLTDAKNDIKYLKPIVTDNRTNLMFLRSDFEDFKTDNTKTINALRTDIDKNTQDLDTKVDNSDIVQTTGTSTTSVMSQKAVSDALSKKADKTELDALNTTIEQNTDAIATLTTDIAQKADKTDLDTKVDNSDIVQTTGTSTTSVMSQKAVSDALSNVTATSEVIYEDYYYPNMGETTDKVNFTDSTEILQPTKFLESYTDANGVSWNDVFECTSFPDWFDFAEKSCYPYGNGNSVGYLFIHNYVVDNNELSYDFYTLQNNNIGQKLPYFTNQKGLGLKKIDATHFKVYNIKEGTTEFTAMNKANVDCSLFAFSPLTYCPIYDIDDCNIVRITLTGNIQSPSRYSSLLDDSCDVGLFGYTMRQVLYGDEYVEIEIDKNNNRWRQIKSGYSMFYRSNYSQNWSANKPESYESECHCSWIKIPDHQQKKICMINKKICYAFSHRTNPLTILRMGCKIKIEKLA